MTIIIFILVLVALIVVHELGHFFAAKWAGMRVDEFGIGYPPRAWTFWKHNGTEYTLNWLPFGGFVKIFGEDESAEGGVKATDSFVSKPHYVQALVLIAGIAMNIVFAWALLSLTLAIGLPRGLSDAEIPLAEDAALAVARVVADSPAADAGLKEGDIIRSASYDTTTFTGADADAFTAFIAESDGEDVVLSVLRAGEPVTLTAHPETLIVPTDPDRLALGIGIGAVGTVTTPWWQAPIEGAVLTWNVTQQVAVGLIHFFGGIFTFTADLSQVSGPIGIAGAVGTASDTSLAALLSLMAVISINLALINIIPVPALDGGRLLFVIIEAITRKPIPNGVANALNTGGFALLILLMLVVTASDLWKAFV
ncbi:MAG TPA: M50 family metallopeptidase [Candidatus Paceibacterota bacterium]|nr:M50 family metallopeptidase [Candidatus Paceibacterota bacterium]